MASLQLQVEQCEYQDDREALLDLLTHLEQGWRIDGYNLDPADGGRYIIYVRRV